MLVWKLLLRLRFLYGQRRRRTGGPSFCAPADIAQKYSCEKNPAILKGGCCDEMLTGNVTFIINLNFYASIVLLKGGTLRPKA